MLHNCSWGLFFQHLQCRSHLNKSRKVPFLFKRPLVWSPLDWNIFLQTNCNMVRHTSSLFRVNICMTFGNSYYFFSGRGAADQEGLSHWVPQQTPGPTPYPANGRHTPKFICTEKEPKSHSSSVNIKEMEKANIAENKNPPCVIPKNNKSPWQLQSFDINQYKNDTAGAFCCGRHPRFQLSFSVLFGTFTLVEFRKTTTLKRGMCSIFS